jgi:hypothetical protein
MLWKSLLVCYGALFACALEVFPPLNDLLQLAEFPDTTGGEALAWVKDSNSLPSQSSLPFVASLNRFVQSIGFPLFMTGLMLFDTLLSLLFEKAILRIFET